MTSVCEYFIDLIEIGDLEVVLVDDSVVKVVRSGKI
jgi:hypothetical protein